MLKPFITLSHFRLPPSSLLPQDFAADKKAAGLAAIDDLRAALDQFQAVLDTKDKQEVPLAQQRALNYVSIIEESMVSVSTPMFLLYTCLDPMPC